MSILGRIERKNLALNDKKAWNTSLWNLRGSQSISGETVTQETALTYSPFWNAVALIAGTLGSLPLHLMRKEGKNKESATDVGLYRLMHDTPNPYMTAMAFRECQASHILTWGNGYAEKVFNVMGEVTELWPIPPNRVTDMKMTDDGDLWYEIDVGGEKKWLPRKQILHIPGLGFDGFVGYSVVAMARKSLGLGMAMETFGSHYFGQGTHPGVIVSTPNKLNAQSHTNLKTSLTETYSGLGQTHRLMLLEEGMKIENVGVPPNDSQFLECVTPETLITMANGARKPAKSINPGDEVVGWDDGEAIIANVIAVGKPKVKNLVKMRTARGRELIASEDHPCLTIRKLRTAGSRPHKVNPEKWVAIKDLNIGNYVRVAFEIPPVESTMTFDEGYFLGAMAGNGYIRKGSCTFTTADSEVVDRMGEIMGSFGGELKPKPLELNDYNYEIKTNGQGRKGSITRTILNESGMVGSHSPTKILPNSVIQGGRESWVGFLSGYFDTDGSIRDIGEKQTPAMYWSSTSLILLQESQHLLSMLGIQSAIYDMGGGGKKEVMGQICDTHQCWGLYIMGISQMTKAAEILILSHSEKSKRLEEYKDAPPSRYREENFLYDRVVSVEEIGEGVTIGLEIEGCHTHITSGIVTHNSRQFQIPEVARWFNLPPHKLKDLTKSSFNNIESEQISFVTDSILPWLIRLEQNYNMQLLTDRQKKKGDLYFHHVVEGLLRANAKDRSDFYKVMVGSTIMTPNEVRALENMNPSKDPLADELFIMVNMMPLSKLDSYLENNSGGDQEPDSQTDVTTEDEDTQQPTNVRKIGRA